MIQTEDSQVDSIKSQKKKTGLFLAIVFVLLLFRIVVLAFDKSDSQSILIFRSFVGNGFLSKPLFSELILSILIIWMLFRKERINKLLFSDIKSGLINTFWFLAFPVITAFCLFTFKSEYFFNFQFNEMLLLRWLCFILTFVAVNKIIDINPFHKFLRIFLIILILILTSFLQEITSNSSGIYTINATLFGTGVTQAFSIIAFRNTYKNSFWAGLFSVIFTGFIVCFFVFGAVSGSYFTLLLPFTALLLAAISLHSKSLRSRIISLGAISLFSLGLSLLLPSLVPPEYRDLLKENRKVITKYQEQASGIQINYNDTSVHKTLIQIAKVLDAANKVSQENFGFSPNLQWITIYGIEQGGFNAVFPNGIAGNLLSQQYINRILDSAFLNNPNLSCQFPDPVNSILHEYSHLYGIFPYQKWLNSESEGWATYSATRLSKLIFQKYGASLWQPSYNYARLADSINKSLLSAHPLVWSHPEEVGPFKMWNEYEQKYGLQNVYRTRWQYTTRDKNAINIQENDPSLVRDFIDTKIGKESFHHVSDLPSRKFDELFKLSEYINQSRLINIPDDYIEKHVAYMKMGEININVPEPKKNPANVEIVLIISLILLFISGKLILKNTL